MSEQDDTSKLERLADVDRRKFLAGVGAGMSTLAGCGGGGDEAEPETVVQTKTVVRTKEVTPTPTESPTATPEMSVIEGGTPVEGMDTAPDTLNVLSTSTAYSFEILDKIYTWGTTTHPETQEYTPWAFRDWTLNPDNIGTSSPTIVGELRDDMTFNDGEDLTAEDVKFTVEYVKEQEPAGTVAASQFASVESVEVDSPDGTTVNYFLSQKDNAWFTSILGNVILPQHIWSNVSDYQKYSPRKSKEGLVGSGPMVLKDFNWENWFELGWREDDAIWQPGADYVDWIDEEAPFTDGWRLEVFGSQNALQQAVLDGDIDVAYGSFTVDKAVTATEKEFLEVKESDDNGWSHQSWNTRRVPLDDVAFRQFLVKMMDSSWVIDELKKGIGSVEGTYATPKAYGEWRPPEPSEIDEFEGIPVPNLDFPGEAGTFQLGDGLQGARDFLVNHDEAKHDYEFKKPEEPVDGAAASDGKVLHVNGKPLNEAHTDNEGNPGQGPLEFSFNPPQEDVDEARIAQRWTGAVKQVGVPMTTQVQSFNSQIPKVYGQENFDIFAMGWVGIGVNNDHYKQLFGNWGADLEGDKSSLLFNPMGYTGADDLIEQQATLMSAEKRKPIVKQVLAQMWHDAPTDVVHHSNILQPVNKKWRGWIQQVGGVLGLSSFLNVRQVGRQ